VTAPLNPKKRNLELYCVHTYMPPPRPPPPTTSRCPPAQRSRSAGCGWPRPFMRGQRPDHSRPARSVTRTRGSDAKKQSFVQKVTQEVPIPCPPRPLLCTQRGAGGLKITAPCPTCRHTTTALPVPPPPGHSIHPKITATGPPYRHTTASPPVPVSSSPPAPNPAENANAWTMLVSRCCAGMQACSTLATRSS